MAFDHGKHVFPYCFMILLSVLIISSCCTSSFINDHDHQMNNDHYLQQESGYDFRAYPSDFWQFRGVKFDNKSGKKYRRILAESVNTIDVHKLGAKGDGVTDDTEAFQKAWEEACSSSAAAVFVVPEKKSYLLKHIRFSGPCTSQITMQIRGTIIASNDRSDYSEDMKHWIVFDNVQNLQVEGGGIIDGNGKIWWQSSCKINKIKQCMKYAPTALTFHKCKILVVKNLKIENAQQIHVSFEHSADVQASNIVVNAPSDSPNTDGIHVSETKNIIISDCTIGTGDDCISIVSGSNKVQARQITCGPGHGISIGSLGSKNSEAHVSDVVVDGAKLSGTTNGVRIKTWQGGYGSASNIKFQNVEMKNVMHPIIIDQNYCDLPHKKCHDQDKAVQIENVLYQNITGTSASYEAIVFNCNQKHPCRGIVMQNVDLALQSGAESKAVCNNVNFQNPGIFSPRCP